MKPACTAGTCQTQTLLSVDVKHLVKQTGKIKRAFLLNWLQILNKTGAYDFHLHQQLFRPARVVFYLLQTENLKVTLLLLYSI